MVLGIYYNGSKERACEIDKILNNVAYDGVEFCAYLDGFATKPDFVVSFGGDGTMLSAVKIAVELDVPLFGVNIGNIGFLTSCDKNGFSARITSLLRGEYSVKKCSMLETCYNGSRYIALNEILLYKKNIGKTIRLTVQAGNDVINTFKCDGCLVSTPTGSTAYALSSGGPILSPDVLCNLIVPLNCHNLTSRPIVTSDSIQIIMNTDDEACLVVDGIVIGDINEVCVQKSHVSAQFVTFDNDNFFSRLHDKLSLGVKGE